MNQTNKFYVLEGLDGVGKSTIGKKLSHVLGGKFIETPTKDFEPLKRKIFEKPYDVQFLFFMASNMDASYQINDILKQYPVVCVRYIPSTVVAYCTYTGECLEDVLNEIKLYIKKMIKPDKTILLQVSEEEWYERIYGRGHLDNNDEKFIRDKKLRSKAMEIYLELAEKEEWIIFDTSNKMPEESVAELYNLLENMP